MLVSGWSGGAVTIHDESASVPRATVSSSPDTHAGLQLSLMRFPDFRLFMSPYLATLHIRESHVCSRAPQLFQFGKTAVMSVIRLTLRAGYCGRNGPLSRVCASEAIFTAEATLRMQHVL